MLLYNFCCRITNEIDIAKQKRKFEDQLNFVQFFHIIRERLKKWKFPLIFVILSLRKFFLFAEIGKIKENWNLKLQSPSITVSIDTYDHMSNDVAEMLHFLSWKQIKRLLRWTNLNSLVILN